MWHTRGVPGRGLQLVDVEVTGFATLLPPASLGESDFAAARSQVDTT
ncbi:MAG: hypothetical protein ABR992_04075 [Solirubrobacteraceae bacterium]